MNDQQYEELYKLVLHLQDTVNHIEADLSFDRSRLEKLENKISEVKRMQETLQDRIPSVENKMADAVSNAVSEAVQPVIDKTQEVIDQKVIVVTKKHPLWLPIIQWIKKL